MFRDLLLMLASGSYGLAYGFVLAFLGLLSAGWGHGTYVVIGLTSAPFGLAQDVVVGLLGAPIMWMLLASWPLERDIGPGGPFSWPPRRPITRPFTGS